jgi:hypothetical protein
MSSWKGSCYDESDSGVFRWVLLTIFLLVVSFFAFIWYAQNWQIKDIDINNLPQFIQADFIDLDRIYSISNYRSGIGHDASANGETCRSMRHYFRGQSGDEIYKEKGYDPNMAISIFSPVDGRVLGISGDTSSGKGQQINIKPNNASGFNVRIYNVFIDKGIHFFSKLKAGQKIGGSMGVGEITISYNRIFDPMQFSYFSVMPDDIFVKYQARGIKNREELIITKTYRDAHPLQCEDTSERNFIPSAETDSNYSFVLLSG